MTVKLIIIFMLIYLSLNLNSDLKQSECNIIQIYQKKNLSI